MCGEGEAGRDPFVELRGEGGGGGKCEGEVVVKAAGVGVWHCCVGGGGLGMEVHLGGGRDGG